VVIALTGRRSRVYELRIISFLHVAELLRGGVNAPQLVSSLGTRDEVTMLIPAVDPGDAMLFG
jgi:hypothetical protein